MKQNWAALAAQGSPEKGAVRGKAGVVEAGGGAATGPRPQEPLLPALSLSLLLSRFLALLADAFLSSL